MNEIPEAVGRPLIIEYGNARRKAGIIESATRNEDGSVTVIATTETGYFAAKTSNPFIDFRESNLEAIRELIDNPLKIGGDSQ